MFQIYVQCKLKPSLCELAPAATGKEDSAPQRVVGRHIVFAIHGGIMALFYPGRSRARFHRHVHCRSDQPKAHPEGILSGPFLKQARLPIDHAPHFRRHALRQFLTLSEVTRISPIISSPQT